MKLSDYVVQFFEKKRVKDIFLVTGGGCMHLTDSFGSSKKIKYWCMQHEQAAAMAAEGYAKANNTLGLTLVTSGPGATNTITGVVGMYQDSIPGIFLSGQAKKKQTVYNAGIEGLRQFGVQEVNMIPIVNSITKYAVMINNPERIRYHLEKAVYLATTGRPGPVWLDIPLDVQSAQINVSALEGFDPREEKEIKTIPDGDELNCVSDLLKNAKRPVIIAGHGIRLAGACNLLEKFLEKSQIPVVTPIMGIDVLADEHPCNIGRIGTKGTRAGNFAMQNADVVVSIGSRLPVSVVGHEYELFAREATVVVVDIDRQEHLKRTINIDHYINSDAGEFLNAISGAEVGNHDEWRQKCGGWKKRYPVCLPSYEEDAQGLNYYKFVDELTNISCADWPIVSDAGSAFYVVSQAIRLKQNQRYITSGAIATMGFTLPAAIGTSVANNKGTVLAVTGDGSFQQNIQELQVMYHHNLPIKLFVMNNGGYFSIRKTESRYFDGRFVGESEESGLSFPETSAIAGAYKIPYLKVSTVEDCEKSLAKFVQMPGPGIVEVMLNKDIEIIPTNASLMRADGIMVSKPLEDMYPFLPREEFAENMIIRPISE